MSLARPVFNLKAIEFGAFFAYFHLFRHLKVIQLFQKYAKTLYFQQAFRQKNRLKIALQVSKLGFSPIVKPVHCHGTYIYVANSTIPVAKDVYIRPTSISFLRICQSPATGVVVVACLRGVFFVSSLIAACSSGPFSLRKQFFYASRGFCPNGGKQRCGCSQMRQAGTSCTFDGFRYDGDRGESSSC